MSHEYESEYEIEKQRRQEINNQRVRSNTTIFYEKYESIYQSLINQGMEEYIPEEMARLKTDLDDVMRNLADNPFAARDISMQIQKYIYGLGSLGRAAKGKFEAAERQRQKELAEAERMQREIEAKARSEKLAAMSKEYFATIRSIKNPAIQNFCSSDFMLIKEDFNKGKISDIEELKERLTKAISSAENKVSEWKKQTLQNEEKNIVFQQTEELLNTVKAHNIEDQEKKQKIIRTIEKLKNSDSSVETVADEISKINQEVEETLVSEDLRREAVKAIFKQLKSQNFTVEPPQLIKNGNENFVKIIARMPSGKRAVCNLTNKGKIIYKFDNYEGMTCLKDIQKFNVDLENIYSVKLSNERVLWSNPDEIGKDAINNPDSVTNKRG